MTGKSALQALFLAILLCSSAGNPAGAGSAPIPPGEPEAKEALSRSPRHHEWVGIAVPGRKTPVTAFVAYPERKTKAPVVIVIHEVYGLSDWIRGVADRLAAEGFLAIAPDFLSGRGPGGKGTGGFPSRDDVVKAVRGLEDGEVTAMIDAAGRYGRSLPAAGEKLATVGFCWGGGKSFRYAAMRPDLDAAVVYYGTSPDPETLKKIRAPVLGLYGGDDARVNETVGPAAERMKELGRTFDTHTYPGAGHGFLRAQEGREVANLAASRKAWPATIDFLTRYLE